MPWWTLCPRTSPWKVRCTTCPLSEVEENAGVFDSWIQIWIWFQTWSWIRTCWWKNNRDSLVWQWRLSIGWFMVSCHLPPPTKTQGLKEARIIPLFSPTLLYTLPFLCISHKDPCCFLSDILQGCCCYYDFVSPGSRLRKSGAFAACKTLCWSYQRTPGTTLNKAQSLRPASSAWCIGQEIFLKL